MDPSTLASAYRAMPDFTFAMGMTERVWRRLPTLLIGYSSIEPRGFTGLTAGARGDGAFRAPLGS